MGKIQGTETKSEGENDDLKLDKFQEQVLQKLQTIQTTENIHETELVLSKLPYRKEEREVQKDWDQTHLAEDQG